MLPGIHSCRLHWVESIAHSKWGKDKLWQQCEHARTTRHFVIGAAGTTADKVAFLSHTIWLVCLRTALSLKVMQSSPAFGRNRDAIFEAMQQTSIVDRKLILELGSGPGEHVPYFVSKLGDASPTWQPTDFDRGACDSADAHAASKGLLGNKVLPAKLLDICADEWPVDSGVYDACLTINVIHIAPHACIPNMFKAVSRALLPGGLFAIYDTWTFAGEFVGPSNRRFDASLRSQGYSGVATIEECDAAASQYGLRRRDILYLPANNQFVVYVKQD